MNKFNVLMVGVGPKRVGGMWTVADQYIKSKKFNSKVNLTYIATSTNGSKLLRFIYMLIGYIKILWVLNFKPIDIVHIHMAEKGSAFRKGRVAKWAARRGKKVIIHLHAGPFMTWYNSVSINKQKRIKKIFEYADYLLVLGEYWKKELTVIIPESKMIVLYNGVDCPEENPYNSDTRNIVYFGVMRKEKGTYDLINAIGLINNQLPNYLKVVLCGNDLEGDISETIEKAGLKERFILTGWVTGEKKEDIFRNAMIDVLPSYFEGLSMTVLEAMARGIPVVTTNISTMPEVIGETKNLVEPGNVNQLASTLLRLMNDKEERNRLSKLEYVRVKEIFSQECMIDKTLEIYFSFEK